MKEATGDLQLKSGWDRVAEVLHLDPMRSIRYQKCVRYLFDCNRGNRIVEIGCGEGSGLEILRSLGFRRVCGLEVSLERLRRARELVGDEIPLALISAAGSLPLRDESVDAVISAAVIEHVLSPADFVREVTRVLRPDGRAVLSSDCYSWRVLQILGIYRSVQPIDRAIFPTTLLRYFRESGLRVISYEGFPLPGVEYRFLRLLLRCVALSPVIAFMKIVPRRVAERIRRLLGRLAKTGGGEVAASAKTAFRDERPLSRPGLGSFSRLIFSDENVFFLTKRSG